MFGLCVKLRRDVGRDSLGRQLSALLLEHALDVLQPDVLDNGDQSGGARPYTLADLAQPFVGEAAVS